MEYLLDTNICIYIIKKKPLNLFERFKEMPLGSIGISSIVLAELEYGVTKSSNPEKNREALEMFLTPLEIVGFDSESTFAYGKIRTRLEALGRPIGPMDTLIAAHAMSLDLTLITNNIREFQRIEGLKLENWIE